ncbi:hypothetical protein QBC46DRAFT_400339 [Diplogelasinospora grovesii]|uniref:Uncharacterized protein n=1 Tax=Diplogelasinospora grovesii TaxID=303347 RepID=A0AAN6RYV3_9PEZI|nr:hypothetical protein QBC46DRAFT_400339 [Diplogelasinospora grovesii]
MGGFTIGGIGNRALVIAEGLLIAIGAVETRALLCTEPRCNALMVVHLYGAVTVVWIYLP